jgi:hypothetical protein
MLASLPLDADSGAESKGDGNIEQKVCAHGSSS